VSDVYTLTLISDGESEVRVFLTEQGRANALQKEVIERYTAAQETGQVHPDDLGKLSDALNDPAGFINNLTYGETEVCLSTARLEG
jgi:hypothetical protein